MNSYMARYHDNQIQTASPEQILIMLYDGAILFCRQASLAMKTGDRAVKCEKISRAVAIVCEFSNSLDHALGGKIAADLDALYSFMIRELTRANMEDEPEPLQLVEDMLTDLRQTWEEAAGTYTRERQILCETTGSTVAAVL
ncbi:MAG: flagellar export chaperone FliS [Deltaproteobacteria bacterium]|nr:flagellar export chaperone FliS [Deltaproteobacteria bacterium]MBW2659127.1 flagellar export chaperone FliS [Deltaproteobacteria bacterium]